MSLTCHPGDPRHRFAEWSSACAHMQLKALVDDPRALSVYYMGLFMQDDAAMMDKSMSNVAGQFMSKWYDQSDQAGPARRPQSNFLEPMPSLEILTVADSQLKILRSNSKKSFHVSLEDGCTV